MNFDREFNPYVYQEGELEDVDVEDIVVEPTVLEQRTLLHWPNPDADDLEVDTVFDGFMLVSDKMSIVDLPGVQQIRKFPTVFDNRACHYKGFSGYFGPLRHIYEINLFTAGSYSFNALLVTNDIVRKGTLDYKSLVIAYHEAIRRTINSLTPESLSRREQMFRTDGFIHIYSSDWSQICNLLPAKLNEMSSDHYYQTSFPPHPKYYWCAKLLGQNQSIGENDISALFYDNLQLNGNYKAAIHLALDIYVRDSICFWDPSKVQSSWPNKTPKGVYRVGLVPGLGNVVYEFLDPVNSIHHVQYYTKLFSNCHRDRSQFFVKPYIAERIAQRYMASFNKTAKPRKEARDKQMQNGLAKFLKALSESVCGRTQARVEFVYSDDYRITNPIEFFTRAYEAITNKVTELQINNLMVCTIKNTMYRQRLESWISPMLSHLEFLLLRMENVTESPNIFIMDPVNLIKPEEIHTALAIETVLNFLIKGQVTNRFPRQVAIALGLTNVYFAAPQQLELDAWPFNGLIMEGSVLKLDLGPQYVDILTNYIPVNLTRRTVNFLSLRGQYLIHSRANERHHRYQLPVYATKLAEALVDIILLFQYRLSSFNVPDVITLQDTLREPFPVNSSFVFMTPSFFIEKITSEIDRGGHISHNTLFTTINYMLQEVTGGRRNFRDELAVIVSDMMNIQKLPFRFSFGPFSEYIVVLDKYDELPLSTLCSVWTKAFKILLRNQTRNMHYQPLRLMIRNALSWIANHSFRVIPSRIQNAILELFTVGRLQSNHHLHQGLVEALLFRENEISYVPVSEPLTTRQSVTVDENLINGNLNSLEDFNLIHIPSRVSVSVNYDISSAQNLGDLTSEISEHEESAYFETGSKNYHVNSAHSCGDLNSEISEHDSTLSRRSESESNSIHSCPNLDELNSNISDRETPISRENVYENYDIYSDRILGDLNSQKSEHKAFASHRSKSKNYDSKSACRLGDLTSEISDCEASASRDSDSENYDVHLVCSLGDLSSEISEPETSTSRVSSCENNDVHSSRSLGDLTSEISGPNSFPLFSNQTSINDRCQAELGELNSDASEIRSNISSQVQSSPTTFELNIYPLDLGDVHSDVSFVSSLYSESSGFFYNNGMNFGELNSSLSSVHSLVTENPYLSPNQKSPSFSNLSSNSQCSLNEETRKKRKVLVHEEISLEPNAGYVLETSSESSFTNLINYRDLSNISNTRYTKDIPKDSESRRSSSIENIINMSPVKKRKRKNLGSIHSELSESSLSQFELNSDVSVDSSEMETSSSSTYSENGIILLKKLENIKTTLEKYLGPPELGKKSTDTSIDDSRSSPLTNWNPLSKHGYNIDENPCEIGNLNSDFSSSSLSSSECI